MKICIDIPFIHKAPKFSFIPKIILVKNKPNFVHRIYFSFIWLGLVIFIKYGKF